ncbi:MAG: multicopper oxidase [Alphaproteobacteria bacterium]|nr:multicopper oxidase [Alphaproteobacteria bacterium]
MKGIRLLAVMMSFAGGGAAAASGAAPVVHPFESPPVLALGGTGPSSLFAARPGGGVTCNPQGSLSRHGSILSARLDFVRAQFTINNPDPSDPQPNGDDPVELRSYGGCKSGPVIEVHPGDTLRMQLQNRTDPADPSCLPNPPPGLGVPTGVGCYNTTNVHTHGLHVSPAGNSDNVLLNIGPQTEFPYEINIPADHPSGTFWYHAHRHGSTAVQVASGASGVLIIRGERPYVAPSASDPHPVADIDTVLHDVSGARFPEQLFLFQQIAYGCFRNDPRHPEAWWQQLYTSAGLFNVNTQDPNIENAPWICPLSKPGQPVSRGAVENFALQLDSASIWDTNGRFTSINGVVQPQLTVPAGQIQRWRFVHAGIHDTINLQIVRARPAGGKNAIAMAALTGNRLQQKADVQAACIANQRTIVPQFEIAGDGLTRAKMRRIQASRQGGVLESNYLQPGYRSDILVVFPEEGDYCLLDQAAPPAERFHNGSGGGQGPSAPQLLAYVHVSGGKAVTGILEDFVEQALYDGNPQLPVPVRDGLKQGDLRPWAPFLESPSPTGVQQATFAINFPAFTVNGKSYDPNVVNFTRQVNTTDDWLLTAQGEPHIFHIHVNPFQVMDVMIVDKNGNQVSIFDSDGNCKAQLLSDPQQLVNQYCGMYHTFRDTVFVENGLVIKVRTTYDRYIGEFVLHCHILDHEDAGMMANIAIVPNLTAPGGGLGMPSMSHAGGGTH